MATGTANLWPSANDTVLNAWSAIAALAKWEEVAQTTITQPTEPLTTRGITSSTAAQSQGFSFGTEAASKLPTGCTIKAIKLWYYCKPSNAKMRAAVENRDGGKGSEGEAGATTKQWYSLSFAFSATRADLAEGKLVAYLTNEKATALPANALYLEVEWETTGEAIHLEATCAVKTHTSAEVGQKQKVSGTSAVGVQPSAAVAQRQSLSAAASVTFAPAGQLSQKQHVAATSSVALGVAASLHQKHALSGVSSVRTTAAGAITQKQHLSATSALSFGVYGTVKTNTGSAIHLEATCAIVTSPSGAIRQKQSIAATAKVAFAPAGQIKQRHYLSATAGVVTAASGTGPNQKQRLAATANVVAGAAGAIKQKQNIRATSSVTISGSGAIRQRQSLSATSSLQFHAYGEVSGKKVPVEPSVSYVTVDTAVMAVTIGQDEATIELGPTGVSTVPVGAEEANVEVDTGVLLLEVE